MEYFYIIVGVLLVISGLVGCFLPIVPGPPMNYAALVVLHLSKDNGAFSTTFLLE